MASPQKENGYTAISNEILEKLAQTQISGNDRRILDVVIRKTYGFNKKQDKISLSQFVLATLLMKSVVCRGLTRLKSMNIIIRIANDDCTIYQFNKDFDTWKPLAKLLTSEKVLAKLQTTVSKSANESLANLRHTKEKDTKETITKETSNASVAEGRLINSILEEFKTVNPSYEKLYRNKTQRAALGRLIKKWGEQNTRGLIKYLPIMAEDRYVKKIFTPLQLEDNLAIVKSHYNQKKNSKYSVDIIS
jgi:phage replication O-like protein O